MRMFGLMTIVELAKKYDISDVEALRRMIDRADDAVKTGKKYSLLEMTVWTN